MSTLLVLLSLACTTTPTEGPPAATAVQTAPTPAGSIRDVDASQLAADMAAGKVPLLVDVRTPGEFAGGHVPGAVNIPLGELSDRTEELSAAKDGELYFVCHSGARSGAAAKELSALGWSTVNVLGGTSAWAAAGNPTE